MSMHVLRLPAQVFETVGPVVELVVVRDKFTHESKGSAFVWYTNRADADKVGPLRPTVAPPEHDCAEDPSICCSGPDPPPDTGLKSVSSAQLRGL
jgi:hypothetical protein